MASATSDDILRRLGSLIPNGWFGSVAQVRDAVHGGFADGLAWVSFQALIIKEATRRIGTRGWLLDVDAWGFFGNSFLRRAGETDASWRKRYTDEIFRPRVTRAAIKKALFDLTGREPLLFEPWNPNDCGAYDVGTCTYDGEVGDPIDITGYGLGSAGYDLGTLYFDVPPEPSGQAYGSVGCFGSLELPYQLFVTAFRPQGGGVPGAGGFDVGPGGYDFPAVTGTTEYVDMSQVQSDVSDDEIYETVARTQAAGVIAWTAIQD